jgi:predicted amidophosphoribosyltransferase
MTITREQYEAAIPKCCAYQTIDAHESIMLCWGLVAATERGEAMNCDNCTENTMKVGAGETAPCHECGWTSGHHDKRCSGYLGDPETGEPIPTHNV